VYANWVFSVKLYLFSSILIKPFPYQNCAGHRERKLFSSTSQFVAVRIFYCTYICYYCTNSRLCACVWTYYYLLLWKFVLMCHWEPIERNLHSCCYNLISLVPTIDVIPQLYLLHTSVHVGENNIYILNHATIMRCITSIYYYNCKTNFSVK